MKKIREVIAYKHYFEDFLKKLPIKAQDKIFKIIEAIETFERVPSNYLKYIKGTEGLFEARSKPGSDIWRVFCFFDDGKLVILLNGFTKKTQKNPEKRNSKGRTFNEKILQRKKEQVMNTKSWSEIKDEVYGKKGTERRDELDRDFESFKISLLLRKAREEKHLTGTVSFVD